MRINFIEKLISFLSGFLGQLLIMEHKSTFRHTFSKTFMEVLNEFSKTHQNDDRKVFKNEWAAWSQRNDILCLINDEIKSLTNSGFQGDIMDKMFKSARYYFRSKPDKTIDNEKKQRKPYVGLSKLVLEHMDQHIKEHLGLRPEDAYNSYCNAHTQKIKEEIQALSDGTEESINDVYKKYKKTYKNRFYVMNNK